MGIKDSTTGKKTAILINNKSKFRIIRSKDPATDRKDMSVQSSEFSTQIRLKRAK